MVLTGLEEVLTAADVAGDEFANDGKKFFHAKNASAGDITITFVCQTDCNYGTGSPTHDQAVVVTAGEERLIGPFSPGRFNDSDGMVQVTYSAVADLTVAVLGY
jgi:hypothetical protein